MVGGKDGQLFWSDEVCDYDCLWRTPERGELLFLELGLLINGYTLLAVAKLPFLPRRPSRSMLIAE